VILQCLQRDEALRYASVLDLARALEPFASRNGRALVARIAQVAAASRASVDSHEETRVSSGRTFGSLSRSTPRTHSSALPSPRPPAPAPDARGPLATSTTSDPATPHPVVWRTERHGDELGFGAPLRKRPRLGVILGVGAALAVGAWIALGAPTDSTSEPAAKAVSGIASAVQSMVALRVDAPPADPPAPAPSASASASAPPTDTAPIVRPQGGPPRVVSPPTSPQRAVPAPASSARTKPFEDFGGRK
jgi:hypothetical protein